MSAQKRKEIRRLQTPANDPLIPEALARVIEDVAKDARRKPEEYLRDTLVRKGGE